LETSRGDVRNIPVAAHRLRNDSTLPERSS